MKKKSFYLCSLFAAALMFTGCSDSEVTPPDTGENGRVNFEVMFEGQDATTRADPKYSPSAGIPPTQISNLKDLKIMLYKAEGADAGTIRYSATFPIDSKTVETYADVPEGKYVVVGVANSAEKNIETYVAGAAKGWEDYNVRMTDITKLELKHAEGKWPSFATTELKTGNTPVKEPAEVFLAYAEVTVEKGQPKTATLKMKREVSLMRLRIDEKTYLGSDPDYKVKFSSAGPTYPKTSIMIYRTTESMKIGKGDKGGVGSIMKDRDYITIFNDGTTNGISGNVFSTAKTGPSYSGDVLTNNSDNVSNFSYWRDVVVYPNDTKRDAAKADGKKLTDSSKHYFVVICGEAEKDHLYADNTTKAVGGEPVYWWGRIEHNFLPNMIRDVNLFLRTRGMPEPPPVIVETGSLKITVDIEGWNTNILETPHIEL